MKKKTTTTATGKMPEQYEAIRTGIVDLLKSARSAAARNVNSIMTAVYWEIGRRIVESEQRGRRRADYGERLIERLSADLTKQFGRGFGTINLWRMRAFYQAWPEKQILSAPMKESGNTLSPNDLTPALSSGASLVLEFSLPWTSYIRLLSVRRPEARKFYETEALRCGWTTRQLDRQINSQLYERIALSRNKAALLRKAQTAQPGDEITPEEAIRDPFVLEFLDLKDEYSESGLEEALINHLADFLLELGDDFAFLGRQRRLRIDDEWFRIDLIFFHRRLRCVLIIDLKVGRFTYADAGQMQLFVERVFGFDCTRGSGRGNTQGKGRLIAELAQIAPHVGNLIRKDSLNEGMRNRESAPQVFTLGNRMRDCPASGQPSLSLIDTVRCFWCRKGENFGNRGFDR